jgi:hypothetical protein
VKVARIIGFSPESVGNFRLADYQNLNNAFLKPAIIEPVPIIQTAVNTRSS